MKEEESQTGIIVRFQNDTSLRSVWQCFCAHIDFFVICFSLMWETEDCIMWLSGKMAILLQSNIKRMSEKNKASLNLVYFPGRIKSRNRCQLLPLKSRYDPNALQ